MRTIIFILLLLMGQMAYGQQTVVVYGKVNTDTPVNVMVTLPASKAIIGFASLDEGGDYSITLNGVTSKTLDVQVKGFNVKPQIQTLTVNSPKIQADFECEEETVRLEEVKVQAQKINERKDTLNYSVASFQRETDKSIGDVIKNMPGLLVNEDGTLYYNGKKINDFYIENMDMLHGRSDMALNGIRADQVATVQVLQNHQKKRMLHGEEEGDSPALNLKLRDSAKGTWSANMTASLGVTPFLWNSELNVMRFASTMQNLSVLKGNNNGYELPAGNTIGWMTDADGTLFRHTTQPGVDKSLSTFNRSATASVNHLMKVGEGRTLSVNAEYTDNRNTYGSESNMEYFISKDSIFCRSEKQDMVQHDKVLQGVVEYLNNASTHYLENRLAIMAGNVTGQGVLLQGFEEKQNLKNTYDRDRLQVMNKLTYNSRQRNGHTFSWNSTLGLTMSDANQHLFSTGAQQWAQNSDETRIKVKNRVSLLTFVISKFRITIAADQDLNYTRLSYGKTDNHVFSSLENELSARFSIWRQTNRLQLVLNLPVGYKSFDYSPIGEENRKNASMFCFQPDAFMQLKLSNKFSLDAVARVSRAYDAPWKLAGITIHQDYRTTYLNATGQVGEKSQYLGMAALRYKDSFSLLFGSMEISAQHENYSMSDNVSYLDNVTSIERVSHGGNNSSVQGTFSLTKGFYKYNSRITVSNLVNLSQGDFLVTDMPFRSKVWSIQPAIDVSMSFAHFDYTASSQWTYRSQSTNSAQANHLNYLHNKINATCHVERFSLNAELNHYYHADSFSDRSFYFLKARMEYNLKTVTLYVEGNNLLNQNSYRAISNDMSNRYDISYRLRPRNVMFGVILSKL